MANEYKLVQALLVSVVAPSKSNNAKKSIK